MDLKNMNILKKKNMHFLQKLIYIKRFELFCSSNEFFLSIIYIMKFEI